MTIQYASAQTDAEIIKNAGILCGNFEVLLTEKGNRFAEAATAMYGSLVEAEFGSNRWRFTIGYRELSVYTNLDPNVSGWTYQWSLPSDCLMPLAISPRVVYEIVGNRHIYTQSNQPITIKYTKAMPVNMWNPTFKHYMTYALAELMCESVVPVEKAKKISVGRQMWESRALFADGQAQPSTPLQNVPWVNIRFQGIGNGTVA